MTTLIGTITETAVAMYLFGQLFDRWDLSFKIATPLLHVAFSAAQLHGTRIFYKMWRKQERLLSEQMDAEQKASFETIPPSGHVLVRGSVDERTLEG